MEKYSQKSFVGQVYNTIKSRDLLKRRDRIIVALSGGADSVSLLHALLSLKEKLEIEISACHFNHRLRGQGSDNDEKFVRELCQKLEIDCIVGQAEKSGLYKSEDSARSARYAFFEKILQEGRGDLVATAHNLNDQAETLLLRLVRGTGIRGLRSIPFSRQFFIRPLLDISRDEIEKYLKENGIPYVTDLTNFEPDFLRNQIRINLLPQFKKLNPNILENLADLAKIASADYDFIESEANSSMKKILEKRDENQIILNRKLWLALPVSLAAMVLRLAILELSSLDDITTTQLEEVNDLLRKGVGEKYKILPHSLRISLRAGKIVISKS